MIKLTEEYTDINELTELNANIQPYTLDFDATQLLALGELVRLTAVDGEIKTSELMQLIDFVGKYC